MPQIKLSRICLSILLAVVMAGCGDTNSKAIFGEEHPSDWETTHKTSAKADMSGCASCHGEDFRGGVSKVACTSCHLGSESVLHPLDWNGSATDQKGLAYAWHKSYVLDANNVVDANKAATCKVCHGENLTGLNSAPSCANCHMAGTATAPKTHAWTETGFIGHVNYFSTNVHKFTTCKTDRCHGNLLTGVSLSGPNCVNPSAGCHTALPAEAP